MIRAIVFLQLVDLSFPTGDPLLGFQDGVERSFQPAHPASQCCTLAFQARSELLEPTLLQWIWSGRGRRANETTT
jgi:hypothetical protein